MRLRQRTPHGAVLELSGARDPILLANLAWSPKTQGRMEGARSLYEESVAAAPEIRQTLLGWARLEEADRRFDAGWIDGHGRLPPGGKVPRCVKVPRRRRRAIWMPATAAPSQTVPPCCICIRAAGALRLLASIVHVPVVPTSGLIHPANKFFAHDPVIS